jgi:hypothetical protein
MWCRTQRATLAWLAIAGGRPLRDLRFAGITMEVFEEVHAHHHPDYMRGVDKGYTAHRHRFRHRNAATEREQTPDVTKIADYSRVAG